MVGVKCFSSRGSISRRTHWKRLCDYRCPHCEPSSEENAPNLKHAFKVLKDIVPNGEQQQAAAAAAAARQVLRQASRRESSTPVVEEERPKHVEEERPKHAKSKEAKFERFDISGVDDNKVRVDHKKDIKKLIGDYDE